MYMYIYIYYCVLMLFTYVILYMLLRTYKGFRILLLYEFAHPFKEKSDAVVSGFSQKITDYSNFKSYNFFKNNFKNRYFRKRHLLLIKTCITNFIISYNKIVESSLNGCSWKLVKSLLDPRPTEGSIKSAFVCLSVCPSVCPPFVCLSVHLFFFSGKFIFAKMPKMVPK